MIALAATRRLARAAALTGALTALASPVPATAATTGTADFLEASERSGRVAVSTAAMNPCQDGAYNLFGGKWAHPVHWTFQASSTPSTLNVNTVEAVITKSFDNITDVNNDCGRPDNVSAENVYDGRNARAPNISRFGFCKSPDGKNAVGFGQLPMGVLAVTCTRNQGNSIVEADIRISTQYKWALSAATCVNKELLEPTVTHEVGHVFGLGHVNDNRHPLLTMSTKSDGACNDEASTLAWGDIRGLQALY